jgi:hypothetical protein
LRADLEPNSEGNRLQGIFFSNVSLLDNARGGWTLGPYALHASGVPIDITIENMEIRGALGVPWGGRPPVPGVPSEFPDGPQLGGVGLNLDDCYNLTGSFLTIRNVSIRDTAGPAISVSAVTMMSHLPATDLLALTHRYCLQVGNFPNGAISTVLENVDIANSSYFVIGSRRGFVGPGNTPGAFGRVPPIMIMPTGGCEFDNAFSFDNASPSFQQLIGDLPVRYQLQSAPTRTAASPTVVFTFRM